MLNKKRFILPKSVELDLKDILRILIVIISIFLFFVNIETIYAYDPSDIYQTFRFIICKHNILAMLTITFTYLSIYILLGNMCIAYFVMSLVSFIHGLLNRLLIRYRGTFIKLDEILDYKEALGLKRTFSDVWDIYILLLLIINVLFGFAVIYLKYPNLNKKMTGRKGILRILVPGILFAAYIMLYMISLKNSYINSIVNNDSIGATVTLNASFFKNFYENAAENEIAGIEIKYEDNISSEEKIKHTPNIIVIMSEAYWDIGNLADSITVAPDPMRDFYDIKDGALYGECAVDVFGGGTNISEMEFNTGYYTGNPYGIPGKWFDLSENHYDTFASYLKNQGYYCMAMHGYKGDYYDRNIIYPNMGFDVFYENKDFINREMYNGYISDESLTREIITRYEQQKKTDSKTPIYTFAISIQNHVHDLEDKESMNGDRTGMTEVGYGDLNIDDEHKKRINKYIDGIYLSNMALKELTGYFSECDDDTMVVFFGDHAPEFNGLDVPIYNEAHKNRTPYMIWTNYDNDYKCPEVLNLSYLSTVIVDSLNMPDTLLTKKNKYLMKKYPLNSGAEKPLLNKDGLSESDYLEDMKEERLLYCYWMKKNRKNSFLWSTAL